MIRLYLIFFLVLLAINSELSFAQNNIPLQKQRVDIIKKYVNLLGKGDYEFITKLFTKDSLAISSSGKSETPVNFYKTLFTKTISDPQSALINIFAGQIDSNMIVGYFNFTWKNMQGNKVHAKFLDLFVFEHGTLNIKRVFVFSNTFQEDIMTQLKST